MIFPFSLCRYSLSLESFQVLAPEITKISRGQLPWGLSRGQQGGSRARGGCRQMAAPGQPQQRGIKGRNTQELCFRESVSLDDSKVHLNPAQAAFLPPRAEFSAGPATTVANVSPVPCRTRWPCWTHLSQVELPPPSVTVQKMGVLFAVPGNSWVSKSEAQH